MAGGQSGAGAPAASPVPARPPSTAAAPVVGLAPVVAGTSVNHHDVPPIRLIRYSGVGATSAARGLADAGQSDLVGNGQRPGEGDVTDAPADSATDEQRVQRCAEDKADQDE